MYDGELNLMFQCSIENPLTIKRLVPLNEAECLFFSQDGHLVILNTEQVLEEEGSGSIYQLKSEDYKDLLHIKAKENFFFTIESHKMEFFSASSYKKSDTWDYFLPYSITGWGKNREGSKLCVWD